MARSAVLLLVVLAVCASTGSAVEPGFKYHHDCYNAVSYALYFGTATDMAGMMTAEFRGRREPADLLASFDAKVGRGIVQKGQVQNIDRLIEEDVYGEVQRVLFIPWDADKAAYILSLVNSKDDGCKLDSVSFR